MVENIFAKPYFRTCKNILLLLLQARDKRVGGSALRDPESTPVLVKRGQDAPESSFAAILLDAPCAGLGSLRRKPESRWTKTPENARARKEMKVRRNQLKNEGP